MSETRREKTRWREGGGWAWGLISSSQLVEDQDAGPVAWSIDIICVISYA